ncbi:hypothetical protein HOP54_02475 [Halomonas daqingensis]|uniref:DUF4376 domain-containing protein n=1 Tax=Billgrantia desiderata TaxID=52021 RepID=UPI001F46F752|nr:tail fiber assembly protein [Halomonas desiderata]MCE8027555.1 hypothetical protein [Halomonas desiderata]
MMHYSANTDAFYADALRAAYDRAGTWPVDAVEVSEEEWQTYGRGLPPEGYQRGADADGRPTWVPIPPQPLEDLASRKRRDLESGRKLSEQAGVTLNGIRYAGDPGNRQALAESLDLAAETGQTTFAAWKDSDDLFHADHPVADVRHALLDIATRRGQLIAREGELNAQIDAILADEQLSDDEKRQQLEAVEWSEQ